MNSRTFAVTLTLALLTLSTPALLPDAGGSTLVSDTEARRLGLTRAWFTQLERTRGRGEVVGATLHVSRSELTTVWEVQTDERTVAFSPRDVSPNGRLLGAELAERQAEILRLRLEAAGQSVTVQTREVPQTTIYVSTSHGAVHAYDGETGFHRWSVRVGNPDMPTTEPAANDRYVAVINGVTLYLLETSTGSIAWQRRTTYVPGGPPALSDRGVYVPTVTGRLESYQLGLEGPELPPRFAAGHGRALVAPLVTPNSVVWVTDRGHLTAAWPRDLAVRFRLEARQPVLSAPSYRHPTQLFVTSWDGYLYCVQEINGQILWRVSTGERISQGAAPIGDSVYLVTDSGLLYRIDASSGETRWTTSGIGSFVAAADGRIFVTDHQDRLAVVDAETGILQGVVSQQPIESFVRNLLTDRVYVLSGRGTLQCLRGSDDRWPHLHVDLGIWDEELDEQALEAAPTGAPAAPVETPAPRPLDDPFGDDPFGDDPFDPFDAADDDDPFGF